MHYNSSVAVAAITHGTGSSSWMNLAWPKGGKCLSGAEKKDKRKKKKEDGAGAGTVSDAKAISDEQW
jgi:hypothetical protein